MTTISTLPYFTPFSTTVPAAPSGSLVPPPPPPPPPSSVLGCAFQFVASKNVSSSSATNLLETTSPPTTKTVSLGMLSPSVKQQFSKTKMCPFHAKGHCHNGCNCTFAHSEEDLRPLPDLRNTKLCEYSRKTVPCPVVNCAYAHNVEDLRPSTDLQTFKTSLCFFWKKGTCFNGAKCRFAHGFREMRNRSNSSESLSGTAVPPNVSPLPFHPSKHILNASNTTSASVPPPPPIVPLFSSSANSSAPSQQILSSNITGVCSGSPAYSSFSSLCGINDVSAQLQSKSSRIPSIPYPPATGSSNVHFSSFERPFSASVVSKLTPNSLPHSAGYCKKGISPTFIRGSSPIPDGKHRSGVSSPYNQLIGNGGSSSDPIFVLRGLLQQALSTCTSESAIDNDKSKSIGSSTDILGFLLPPGNSGSSDFLSPFVNPPSPSKAFLAPISAERPDSTVDSSLLSQEETYAESSLDASGLAPEAVQLLNQLIEQQQLCVTSSPSPSFSEVDPCCNLRERLVLSPPSPSVSAVATPEKMAATLKTNSREKGNRFRPSYTKSDAMPSMIDRTEEEGLAEDAFLSQISRVAFVNSCAFVDPPPPPPSFDCKDEGSQREKMSDNEAIDWKGKSSIVMSVSTPTSFSRTSTMSTETSGIGAAGVVSQNAMGTCRVKWDTAAAAADVCDCNIKKSFEERSVTVNIATSAAAAPKVPTPGTPLSVPAESKDLSELLSILKLAHDGQSCSGFSNSFSNNATSSSVLSSNKINAGINTCVRAATYSPADDSRSVASGYCISNVSFGQSAINSSGKASKPLTPTGRISSDTPSIPETASTAFLSKSSDLLDLTEEKVNKSGIFYHMNSSNPIVPEAAEGDVEDVETVSANDDHEDSSLKATSSTDGKESVEGQTNSSSAATSLWGSQGHPTFSAIQELWNSNNAFGIPNEEELSLSFSTSTSFSSLPSARPPTPTTIDSSLSNHDVCYSLSVSDFSENSKDTRIAKLSYSHSEDNDNTSGRDHPSSPSEETVVASSTEKEGKVCATCGEVGGVIVAFVPCGHAKCCSSCGPKWKVCLYCNHEIEMRLPIVQ